VKHTCREIGAPQFKDDGEGGARAPKQVPQRYNQRTRGREVRAMRHGGGGAATTDRERTDSLGRDLRKIKWAGDAPDWLLAVAEAAPSEERVWDSRWLPQKTHPPPPPV
jgi:hypothetical protein